MKVIGLTGGIGSGKSTVAVIFKSLGIPVFNSDVEAKKLYQKEEILSAVKSHFGEAVMEKGTLSFKKLAAIIFNDNQELAWINELIHPLVQNVFEEWKTDQRGTFVLKESAILIESGAYLSCDKVITVEASEKLRIARVMKRDKADITQVEARLSKQWTDQKRRKHADYVIDNEHKMIIPQVTQVFKCL